MTGVNAARSPAVIAVTLYTRSVANATGLGLGSSLTRTCTYLEPLTSPLLSDFEKSPDKNFFVKSAASAENGDWFVE